MGAWVVVEMPDRPTKAETAETRTNIVNVREIKHIKVSRRENLGGKGCVICSCSTQGAAE